MNAKKVLKLLHVTRPTICKYVKSGIIKGTKLPNGYYEYDDESVYRLLGVQEREVVVYGRVSTNNQKDNLKRQINEVVQFANNNGYKVTKVYDDIASGISYDRKHFKELLHDVINHKVKTVIISHKDRLSRVSFDMWKELFGEFNCNIIVMNEAEDDDKGIFEDIISLLHCFAMRMYSKRRKKKLDIIGDDLNYENEIS